MGRVHFSIEQVPEVCSVIIGCQKLPDCGLVTDEVGVRLEADVRELERGKAEGPNGLNVSMLLQERLTFAGHCAASAGACVLKGAFGSTTQSMAAAQDRGLSRQEQ